MNYRLSDITFIVTVGTMLLLLLGGLVTILLLAYKRRYHTYQQTIQHLQETYQRELLQVQLETQNQTLTYVGRELHDNIGQMLSVAMLQLSEIDERTETLSSLTTQRVEATVERTIQAVRQLAKTLDKNTIQHFGLRDSLTLELSRIGQTGRYQTHLQVTGQPYTLGSETEIILFRIAQESLNNAIKHARARTFTITVDYQPEQFTLAIIDDGDGFDLYEATNRSVRTSGVGLHNIYQRVQLIGGTCIIVTRPEDGTRVTVCLPHIAV